MVNSQTARALMAVFGVEKTGGIALTPHIRYRSAPSRKWLRSRLGKPNNVSLEMWIRGEKKDVFSTIVVQAFPSMTSESSLIAPVGRGPYQVAGVPPLTNTG
ncbi:unnamed protein product [Boreogadus saida]